MIKATINHGEVMIQASGNIQRIASEAATMIAAIYEDIMKNNSAIAAEIFRAAVTECMTNPDSPIWDLQDDEGGDQS